MTRSKIQASCFKSAKSKFRGLLVLIILFETLLLITKEVSAQTSTPNTKVTAIEMVAVPAFDGYFKYGEWLPIWIELENNGPDVNAEIQVAISGSNGVTTYTTLIELPTISRKRVPIYILPNNYSRQVEVQLFAGDQLLNSQRINLQPNPNLTYMVGLIGSQRGVTSLIDAVELPGTQRDKAVVDVALAELPERYEALRSFDLIVINNVDTSSMTPEQGSALEIWVQRGGRLVVGGGSNAQNTLMGLPETLLPIKVESSIEVDSLFGLEEYVGGEQPIRVPGPFVLSTGVSDSGRVLAWQEAYPLIMERSMINGYVDFVALDLNASPFDAWSGTLTFWENLISTNASYPDWLPFDISSRQQFASLIPTALSNLPMLDLPSTLGLAIILAIYILLVGPVNYLVLKKKQRLHWAWVTIPAITVFFSIAAFGLGFALHGTDIFINKISIIQLNPDGKALVDGYIGLFSPAQSQYEVEVLGNGLISPLNPIDDVWRSGSSASSLGTSQGVTLVQGNPGYIRGLNVEQWSMQSFRTEGTSMDFGPVIAALRLEEGVLLGEVLNGSSYDIQDAAVIMGSKFQHLGDISAGESATVQLDLKGLSGPNMAGSMSYALFQQEFDASVGEGLPRKIEVKRSIIESLFDNATSYFAATSRSMSGSNTPLPTPIFIGWLDQSPPEVSLPGRAPAQQATAIVMMQAPYSLPESGRVSIPPGLIPGKISTMPIEGGSCGSPGSVSIYLVRGETVFEFSLPVETSRIDIQNLVLSMDSDGGWINIPAVSVFNWQQDEWIALNGINQGENLIPNANGLISSEGLVQVRLSADNAQTCYYVGLGIQGERQ